MLGLVEPMSRFALVWFDTPSCADVPLRLKRSQEAPAQGLLPPGRRDSHRDLPEQGRHRRWGALGVGARGRGGGSLPAGVPHAARQSSAEEWWE